MIERIGANIRGKFVEFGYATGFFLSLIKGSFFFFRQKHVGLKVLMMQILFTGFEALSIIILLGLALGVVIIVQGLAILPQFGQGDLIYTILDVVITRELGPLLTAFVIIARSATAISTELGNMVASQEIEAYVSVGIDPIDYLAVPRFLGVIISIVLLNLYFNIAGLIGSFFVAQFIQTVTIAEYFRNLLVFSQPASIVISFIKSFVFGIIISFSATYNGFKVEGSTTEIPQVVIKAVGQGLALCIIASAIITALSYLWF
ncbi:MAG: ABC transporter permease [Spirochaetaceae bacterium]|nr:ABC transporter permease [Spirochaetaceae bacterium]